MATNNRTEVVRVLREQMEAETDPQKKIEYAKQLAKLLPRPRQARRPRKTEARPPSKKNALWLRQIYTGSVYDAMSDVDLIVHHMALIREKKEKAGECKTKAERDVVKAEVLGSLPDNERAAYEALNAEAA